jgi:hypothetical protein
MGFNRSAIGYGERRGMNPSMSRENGGVKFGIHDILLTLNLSLGLVSEPRFTLSQIQVAKAAAIKIDEGFCERCCLSL